MIIRFGAENHYSLRTYQEVLLTSSSLKDDTGMLIDVPSQRLKLLPIVAVYGANASGKSNLLSALSFMTSAIRNSHTSKDLTSTPYRPFRLDADSQNRPSTYDIDFLIEETRYHYGFRLNGKEITEEWLFAYPGGKARNTRQTWFHRKSGQKRPFYFGKSLRGENTTIARLVRPNSLYLSTAAQNAHPQLSIIYQYFNQKVTRIRASTTLTSESLGEYFGNDSALTEKSLAFLKNADIGISSFNFEKKPIDPKESQFMKDFQAVLKKHIDDFEMPNSQTDRTTALEGNLEHFGENGKSYKIDLGAESSGTRSLLSFLSPLFKAFTEGGVLVFDELSNTLHPLVTRQLLSLITSPISNPARAQLIFTTHDTNLLCGGVLRRDQIWFSEKDSIGATHIYPLSDIKVKASDNFERGYLDGRFGAIPFLSGIEEVAALSHH